jgi:hypothetical protein
MRKKLLIGLGAAWLGAGVATLLDALYRMGMAQDLNKGQRVVVVLAGPLIYGVNLAEDYGPPAIANAGRTIGDCIEAVLAVLDS